MQLLVKVGDKRPVGDPARLKDWLDGHIIDLGPTGRYTGKYDRIHHCVIDVPLNYWDLVGCKNYDQLAKSAKFYQMKRWIYPANADGRWPFLGGTDLDGVPRRRKREFFIDFRKLLDDGVITLVQYESIYDKSKPHNPIVIDRPLDDIIQAENMGQRRMPLRPIKPGTINAGGTYTVGTGKNYSTWSAAIADLPADLGAMGIPGQIVFLGSTTEQITETTEITISLDTDVYGLGLTVASANQHSGFYNAGNHHIVYFSTASDRFRVEEASPNTLKRLVVSDMAFRLADATNCIAMYMIAVASGATEISIQRSVFRGNGVTSANFGIWCAETALYAARFRNNAFDVLQNGISFANDDAVHDGHIVNNTVCKCTNGIKQADGTGDPAGSIIVKNNLTQGCTNGYVDVGCGFGNHAKNASEDGSSPDIAYRNLNCHDGNSCFIDYANGDYRLLITGDEISTLLQGEDLSSYFTDDIIETERFSWYIGANELVSGPNLPLNDIASAGSSIGDVTITPIRVFSGEAIAAPSSIGQPSIIPIRKINISALSSASSITSSAISALRQLDIEGIASASAIAESPTVAVRVLDDISDISSASSIGESSVERIKVLDFGDITCQSQVNQSAISALRELAISDIVCNTILDEAPIVAVRVLNVSDIASPSSISDSTCQIVRPANGIDIASQSQIGQPSISALRQLAVSDIASASSIEDCVLERVQPLIVNNIGSQSAIAQVGISALRELAIDDVSCGSAIAQVTITPIRALSVTDISVATAIGDSAITALRELAVSDISAASQISDSVLTRTTSLSIADVAAGSQISDSDVDRIKVITTQDISISSAIGEPYIGWAGEGILRLKALIIDAAGLTGFAGAAETYLTPFSALGEGICDLVGSGSSTVPNILLSASGIVGETGSGDCEIEVPILTGGDLEYIGDGEADLPVLTVVGSGARGCIGIVSIKLNSIVVSADGFSPNDCQADFDLPQLAISASLATGQISSVSIDLPVLIVSSDNWTIQGAGSVEIELPALTLNANLVEFCVGSASAEISVLILDSILQEDQLADIQNGYKLIAMSVMNKRNAAVTDWEWIFNSFGIVNNSNYGANSDGIYLLDGADDDGSEINLKLSKLEMDMGSTQLKRVTDAFIRLRCDQNFNFIIYADGNNKSIAVSDGISGVHAKKVNLPRGLKGRRLGMSIENTNGGDLLLDKVDLQIDILSRRARS